MKYRKPIILLLLFLQLGCSVTRLQKQGNPLREGLQETLVYEMEIMKEK